MRTSIPSRPISGASRQPRSGPRAEVLMTAFTQFRGRTAVVKGGASGLGRGIARALIAEDRRVVVADIEAAALERTATELGATGLVVDVSDAGSVQSLADEVHRRFGAAARWIEPDEVGHIVVDALRRGALYAFNH